MSAPVVYNANDLRICPKRRRVRRDITRYVQAMGGAPRIIVVTPRAYAAMERRARALAPEDAGSIILTWDGVSIEPALLGADTP